MQLRQWKRREFITLLGGAAAWPLAARAQQPATRRRIAIFHPAIPTTLLTETGGGSAWRAFFGELRRLGYVEGQNLIIERYSAEGHHERYADLARQIVAHNPDVIVTGTNPVVIAFKYRLLRSCWIRCTRGWSPASPTRRHPHPASPLILGSRSGASALRC
jgi:hypothetical protein